MENTGPQDNCAVSLLLAAILHPPLPGQLVGRPGDPDNATVPGRAAAGQARI